MWVIVCAGVNVGFTRGGVCSSGKKGAGVKHGKFLQIQINLLNVFLSSPVKETKEILGKTVFRKLIFDSCNMIACLTVDDSMSIKVKKGV